MFISEIQLLTSFCLINKIYNLIFLMFVPEATHDQGLELFQDTRGYLETYQHGIGFQGTTVFISTLFRTTTKAALS